MINENLKTEVKYKTEVLVAGGGFAGISAALSAAREGANVMLLEREYILGGLGTAGLITIYLPLCDGKGKQVSFGIAEELLRLSISMGAEANSYPTAWLGGGTEEERCENRFLARFNPQLFAILAEQLLISEGVKILYGTSVCAAECESGRIKHLITENKSGRFAIEAKSVVDCTGDADICKFSGEDSRLFEQGNLLAAWHYAFDGKEVKLVLLGASDIPDEDRTGDEPAPLINRRFAGIDGEELSDMVVLSHKETLDYVKQMKKDNEEYVPVTITTIPQIRMTRCIDGVSVMDTKDDHKRVSDSVGLISNWKKRGPIYEVPFSALYGYKIKNLITAGRCISATDPMWDVTRVIPCCAVTGEAAGLAAAVCDDFPSIDVTIIQEKLLSRGVVLHI